MEEKKKNATKIALGSVPVGILALIYQSMSSMTESVKELNGNLAVIASQVQRNTSDIEYQRDRYDSSMEKVREAIGELKALIKRN